MDVYIYCLWNLYIIYIGTYCSFSFSHLNFGRKGQWVTGCSKRPPLGPFGWGTRGMLAPELCQLLFVQRVVQQQPDAFPAALELCFLTNTHLQYFPNKLISSHSLLAFQLSLRAGEQPSSNNPCSGISQGGRKALTSLITPDMSKVSKCIIKKYPRGTGLWYPRASTWGAETCDCFFWNPSHVFKKV